MLHALFCAPEIRATGGGVSEPPEPNNPDMRAIPLLCALPLVALTATESFAQETNWPQFLGPKGATAQADAAWKKNGTLGFDKTVDKLWHVELPGGSSSPCIWGDRLFITAADGNQSIMLAFDRKSGKELWRRQRESVALEGTLHVDSNAAAPTPTTNGTHVAFYFGQYGLVVLDMDGELVWEKPMEVPAAPFGIGTSPILFEDLLILTRDGCPDSAIHAFNIADGEELWRVPRFGFTYSFGTPYIWKNKSRTELVVAGTQRMQGLDLASGAELWSIGGLTSFVCTTPTSDEETLYFAAWSTGDAAPDERGEATWGDTEFSADERADALKIIARLDKNADGMLSVNEMPASRAKDAFRFIDRDGDGKASASELTPLIQEPKGAGNNLMVAVSAGGKGDVSKSHVQWSVRRGLPYVASPLLYDGRVYLAKAGGLVSCINATTGKAHFGPQRLEDHSEYYSTPVGVDGQVLFCSSKGTITVLRAGDEFEVLRTIEFGESIHATPAIVDGTVYLRTDRALWAFAKNGK